MKIFSKQKRSSHLTTFLISPLRYSVILILFFQLKVSAQCFDADTLRGCAPLTIHVTDCSGVDPGLIFYDYGAGGTIATTHTYTSPGLYSITQIINLGGGGLTLTKEDYIEVFAPETPEFEIFTCENHHITIRFTDGYYEAYFVEFGDGSSDYFLADEAATHAYAPGGTYTVKVRGKFIAGGGSCGVAEKDVVTIENLAHGHVPIVRIIDENNIELSLDLTVGVVYYLLEQKDADAEQVLQRLDWPLSGIILEDRSPLSSVYTYRVAAVDSCNDNTIYGPKNQSIHLEITLLDQANQLTWNIYSGDNFEAYLIVRDGITIEEITDVSTVSYIDESVICLQTYCYTIEVKESLPMLKSVSNNVCVETISLAIPDAVVRLDATIDGSLVVFTWEISDLSDFQSIELTDSFGAPFVSSSPTTDQQSRKNEVVCYTAQVVNTCANKSAAVEVCPVFLEALQTTDAYELSWSAYAGSPDSQTYTIELVGSDGSVLATVVSALPESTLNFSDTEITRGLPVIRYRIKVENPSDGAFASYSNVVEIPLEARFEIPDAFTPNGDGLNDYFEIRAYSVAEAHLKILNRQGNIVYQTDQLNEFWDGELGGQAAPSGYYSYHISAVDIFGNALEKVGLILLIR